MEPTVMTSGNSSARRLVSLWISDSSKCGSSGEVSSVSNRSPLKSPFVFYIVARMETESLNAYTTSVNTSAWVCICSCIGGADSSFSSLALSSDSLFFVVVAFSCDFVLLLPSDEDSALVALPSIV